MDVLPGCFSEKERLYSYRGQKWRRRKENCLIEDSGISHPGLGAEGSQILDRNIKGDVWANKGKEY